MKYLENLTFEELSKELLEKSKDVTVEKSHGHTGKIVTDMKIKNYTLKFKKCPHNSRPLSELLR